MTCGAPFVRTARRIMDGVVYAAVDRLPWCKAGAGATAPAERHDTGDGSMKAGSVLSGPAPLLGAGIQIYTSSQTAQPRRVRTVWDEVCVQVQYEEAFLLDACDETVRLRCGQDEKLPKHEREAIWLQTSELIHGHDC